MPSAFCTIGPLSWAGKDSGGVRGAHPSNDAARPALIVLPGILGSNLKVGDERVWRSYRIINGLERLAYQSPSNGGPRNMARMPGFLQLQAGLLSPQPDPQYDLSKAQGWKALAAEDHKAVVAASVWHALSLQKRAAAWGLPEDDVLRQATKLREELDKPRAKLAQLAGNSASRNDCPRNAGGR
ncbi:hypothetical protein P3T43_006088 [Paraburkholderia sp. GAS41]|jgi:hypothetical protein|uniref:hypothetical protein n=1 Tax=Paraburkholderia sp. GAS41 TaxID=3035134 RepID=UPI003D1D6A71